jgi:hypothetical protein
MNTDKAIRQAFKERYLAPNIRVVDELCAGYGRADVVTLNGELVGYEIKSNHDSLSRLQTQVWAYDRVFDRNWVVTTMRHEDKVQDIIPEHWGLIVALPVSPQCPDEVGEFFVAREASANPNQEMHYLLDLIWRDELLEFLRANNARRGCRNSFEMRKRVIDVASIEEIKSFVRTTLLARQGWKQ